MKRTPATKAETRCILLAETFTVDEGLGPGIRIVSFINNVGDHEPVGKHEVACCVSCRQSRSEHSAKTAIVHNHSHRVVEMELEFLFAHRSTRMSGRWSAHSMPVAMQLGDANSKL